MRHGGGGKRTRKALNAVTGPNCSIVFRKAFVSCRLLGLGLRRKVTASFESWGIVAGGMVGAVGLRRGAAAGRRSVGQK